ncbi:MAG: L,D-transpeptidase family protein [Lachnospiraceae bacterium]|nr:L,D-transpeptidase family protein [Lachnospiraceae bacterium]
MKNNIAGKVLRILMYIALPVLAFAITVGVINYVQERRSTENSTPEISEVTEISEISRSDESDINTSAEESSAETSETSANADEPSQPDDISASPENSENAEESSEESSEEDPEEGSEEPEESFEESEYYPEESSEPEPEPEYRTAYLVRVNMNTNVITVFTYDESGEYSIPVKAMICSTGDASPIGTWIMGYQARWNGLILDEWGQYVSHITGDFLFHTVPSAYQSEEAVIAAEYNLLGTTASHGCIRITAGDAYWMYTNCTAYETIVEIGYFDNDPLGKPASIMLPTDPSLNWDPTDPSPDNPWNDKTPYFEGVPETLTLTSGSVLPDFNAGVTAFDTCYNPMESFFVEHDVDPAVPGTYTVTYSCTDVLGRTGTAVTTVTVTEEPAK